MNMIVHFPISKFCANGSGSISRYDNVSVVAENTIYLFLNKLVGICSKHKIMLNLHVIVHISGVC